MFLLHLLVVIFLVLLGRKAAVLLKQPPVLGELVAGLIWANVIGQFEPLRMLLPSSGAMESLGHLGLILLLFSIGLETNVRQMFDVGRNAMNVAVVGVIVPFLLAFGVGAWLMSGDSLASHLFLGATLCATSIGITARVFQDLKKMDLPEARIILGAAVIDDVLGLIVLTVVAGIASSGSVNGLEILKLLVFCSIFIGVVLLYGASIGKFIIKKLSPLDPAHARLLIPLLICFFMAWIAEEIKLAAIVGAFAAGLMVKDQFFPGSSANGRTVKQWLEPLEAVLAPIFFVLIGAQVEFAALLSGEVLLLTTALIVVAILGKLACGWVAGRGYDKWVVGIGMIPRGEVGLIFASVGKNLGVLSASAFSALVVMILFTTVIAPPALNWALKKAHK